MSHTLLPRSLQMITARYILNTSSLRSIPRYGLHRSLPSLSPICLRAYQTKVTPATAIDEAITAPVAPQYSLLPWANRLPKLLCWTHPYVSLARMDKPIGTWLLYWPCAWSLTMAAYSSALPPLSLAWNLALFGTGALVMRGAGCTINDLWDRDIDQRVERTKLRPLASGEVRPFQAFSFLGIQLSVGLGILTQLNWYSIALGASSLSLVVLYPFMKRITYWPQFVLGLAFNWGALLGSSAILNHVDLPVALPLYVGSVAWTIAYDTIYAHQDKVDDVNAGVKSTALLFGQQTKPILTGFSTAFVGLLATSGWMNGQGLGFWTFSVGGAAWHLFNQLKNVELDSRQSCWETFASNRNLGAIVWSGLMVDYTAMMLGIDPTLASAL
ncbi:BQ2448_2184 [Microbotryum intermedium]|uniref:4-hydroxybenzoate polyprenyltransferase, mitochondrial n=1 Tax=Microbotryum intermedium TaxID=269621 RepID=A0A238FB88_9BASI|nr:BQ2448_2184 [Microbotryum intermedium]